MILAYPTRVELGGGYPDFPLFHSLGSCLGSFIRRVKVGDPAEEIARWSGWLSLVGRCADGDEQIFLHLKTLRAIKHQAVVVKCVLFSAGGLVVG